jgi:hypothetical protein
MVNSGSPQGAFLKR